MTPRILALVPLAALAGAAGAQTAFFNDPTDTIVVNGGTAIGTTCTYEAVILFPSGIGAEGRVFNEWSVFQEDKLLYAGPTTAGGWNFPAGNGIDAPVLATPDVWHHIAFVYDGSQERLYFDGVLVASRGLVQTVGNGAGPAIFGAIARDGQVAPSQVGYLQTIRLSNNARYAGASFTPPLEDLGSDSNTLLLFNFNEPAGSTVVQDSGPQGLVGTLGTGFPTATPPVLGAVTANDPGVGDSRDLVLHAPEPNPVVGSTAFRYELPFATSVRLTVYDALGREVAVVSAGDRPAGVNSATLDVSRLPAGAYVVQLSTEVARVSVPVLVRR